jgi:hypothetical protein
MFFALLLHGRVEGVIAQESFCRHTTDAMQRLKPDTLPSPPAYDILPVPHVNVSHDDLVISTKKNAAEVF